MYPEFPTLTADQIECKVKQANENGVVVLLYKTARVDMDMLDRFVGPTNWTNSYRDIDGVLYCSIGIRDKDTGEWVYKEDCGIESREDGEGNEKKGEASDALKRSGFRWGIGRELYSAPFIFISVPTKQNSRGKYEMKNRYEKFSVGSIEYNDDRKISALSIVNSDGNEVFRFPKGSTKKLPVKPTSVGATVPTSKHAENKPKAEAKQEPAPVITGSMENLTPPWEYSPNDEVTQVMLTEIISNYVKGKDSAERIKLTKEVKRMNNGSADYKHIDDPNVRREIYNYFWNLGNFQ